MGLGGSSQAWYRLLPLLDQGVRAIAFDNRGTGRSDGVGVRVTLDDMVADTIAVMDAAGVEDAHVFGVSMGGMVAQRLALEHREQGALADPRLHDRARSRGAAALADGRGALDAPARAAPGDRRCSCRCSTRSARAARRPSASARTSSCARVRRPRRRRSSLRWLRSARTTCVRGSRELDGLDVTVIHGAEDALVRVGRGRELAALHPGRAAARDRRLRPPAADRRRGRRDGGDRRASAARRRASGSSGLTSPARPQAAAATGAALRQGWRRPRRIAE